MATTTMFALSNPGGKRVRIKSRKKATMARRRRRGRRNPGMEGLSAAFAAESAPRKKRRRKAKAKTARRSKARRAKPRKAKTRRAKTRKGKARKRKSAKRVAAGKKAAATKKRRKAARSAAGKKSAKRGSKKRAAAKRKGSGKKKASKKRGKKYGKRPRRGVYRPYARIRKGRRPRFGNRTKKRMAALGLARVRAGKYTLNPRRRRKNPRRRAARRNPSRRRKNPMARRRSSRRRRNPFGMSVRGVRGLFTKGNVKKYAKLGLGAMFGMAVARGGPALLGRLPVVGGFLAPDTPIKAVIGSAVALGLGAMLARKVKIVPSDMVAAGVIGGAGIVAAGILKILSARVPALRMIPGVSGMGDVVSPSQLVAGEAIFGGSGVGDYLQLSGPVPEQYFAGGLNGMGDYIEFQNRAAGVAAEAASAAQVDWSPGNEGFGG